MVHSKQFERGVAAECSDFLAGRFAERLDARRTPAPAWTWLNLLAHAPEDVLRAAAVGPFAASGWRLPRAVVAAAIVELLDDGGWSLAELQRDVLIPLEVTAMRSPSTDERDPDEYFGAVLRTLAEHVAHQTGR